MPALANPLRACFHAHRRLALAAAMDRIGTHARDRCVCACGAIPCLAVAGHRLWRHAPPIQMREPLSIRSFERHAIADGVCPGIRSEGIATEAARRRLQCASGKHIDVALLNRFTPDRLRDWTRSRCLPRFNDGSCGRCSITDRRFICRGKSRNSRSVSLRYGCSR